MIFFKNREKKKKSHYNHLMRIITGDEVGLVKITTFVPAASHNKKLKSTVKQAPPVIASIGTIDRSRGISLLAKPSLSENITPFALENVVVGRVDGSVDIISIDTCNVLNTWKLFTPQQDANGKPLLNKRRKEEHFIGLRQYDGLLISCTDTGVVTYIHSDPNLKTHVHNFII